MASMMKQWQREQEALNRLGFYGTDGNADRERAVDVVISMLIEIENLQKKRAKDIEDLTSAMRGQ